MIGVAVGLIMSAIAAWVITGAVRRYAVARALMDVPNYRSSHTAPTPRGGGLAIATVVLVSTAALTLGGLVVWTTGVAVLIGGGAIAAVGWLDDRRHVPARWRAAIQFLAAGWVVYWIGVPDALWMGPWSLPLGSVGPVLAVVGLVWLTNLFNFMDGIDGLAAGEAVSAASVGGALLLLAGATGVALLAWVVAAATIGFLAWNWPPARIFMGDVGSGLLGFLLGTIAMAGATAGAVPLLVWGILLAAFLFDATVTLFRRVFRRERFFEAHRRHAYQRAVQAGYSHLRVTASVLVLNAALAGLAVIAWYTPPVAPLVLATALIVVSSGYLVIEYIQPMWTEPISTAGRGPEHTDATRK
jgi:Fuc2NAc and GlcNAc transferase